MGSCEEYSSAAAPQETPNQTQPESASGFRSKTVLSSLYPGTVKEEESLVGGLKNVTLEENDWDGYGNNNSNENLQVELQNGENYKYALMPKAGDCSFYRKTGKCKFGFNCKFSHPIRRGFQDKENHQGWSAEQTGQVECKRAIKGCKYGNACKYRHSNEEYVLAPVEVNSFGQPEQVGMNEKREKDGFVEQTAQIECKYYLSSGGCKYGKACRYGHSKEKSRYLEKFELPPPELNFLGLPIRTLEKECPYYMRTGSCAYGSNCRFNHPDPTAAEGSSTVGSDPSGFGFHFSGYYDGESDALPLSTEPTAASLSLNMMSNEHDTCLKHNSPYARAMQVNSEWNGHQEKTSNQYLAPSIDKAISTADISKLHQEPVQVDEIHERLSASECPHFMKTGYCKYKSAHKFHHPKTRPSKPILSRPGLPLRPERRICWNYEKSGVCKYGWNWLFHHPENLFL